MERLYELFEHADELGSLITPDLIKSDMFMADLPSLLPLLRQVLPRESEDVEITERAVVAQGMSRAAEILFDEYTLAITNVPYLGRNKQDPFLKEFGDKYYKESKADLSSMFVERMLDWVGNDGTVAAVTPLLWLFLSKHKAMRRTLLEKRTWNLVALLGPGAFETITGEVVKVAMPVISGMRPAEDADLVGIDASNATTPVGKAELLSNTVISKEEGIDSPGSVLVTNQRDQLSNPDSTINLHLSDVDSRLGEFCHVYQGIGTGDENFFIRRFWEFPTIRGAWVPYQKAPEHHGIISGCNYVLRWEDGQGLLSSFPSARVCGKPAWQLDGVALSVSKVPRCDYKGAMFDCTLAALIPNDPSHLGAIRAFVFDDNFRPTVKLWDPAFSITESSFGKAPFDLEYWQKIADQDLSFELSAPQSDDPTQWLFHGHPAKVDRSNVLQVATARLLGYRWPIEHDETMEVSDDSREWVVKCGDLSRFGDSDGIVCLAAIGGATSAADRLRELLSCSLPDWSYAIERELVAKAGTGNSSVDTLEIWLKDRFFEEHCKLFNDRPFIWHIWDGNPEGFHCLVNAHKLTGPGDEARRTLETITYSLLGAWIERQRSDHEEGKDGSDGRLVAAQNLQDQLKNILAGEPPYDIFVRWKPLDQQPIGWEPDIDDGVITNIRPFLKAELSSGGKKGAGILRSKPNTIKWQKHQGNDLQYLRPKLSFPWSWGCKGDGNYDDRADFTAASDFDGIR
ncbi:BREX-1 system adenine-specific DNA-methyltransferase PglX, partial [Dehalococcoidia bacterium]|nr:BREX-1 system adenine-specific DNA-methyltransferase PglX [Dehalococcoidia bacterium]